MIHVHVEAHADGVGRHQEIHIARLIEIDLRVAGARRKRAHHHGCPAPLPPHDFSKAINRFRRKGHDRGPAGQAAQFARARMGQFGKPRPCNELCLGQQGADHIAHGLGAEKHGLGTASGMEQPIREHMTPFRIGA